MSYSQALEQQIALLRSVQSGFSGKAMRHVEYSLSDQYGAAVMSGRLNPQALPRTTWERQAAYGLRTATPYFWCSAICDVISSAACDMPPWRLILEALPSRDGFFWFQNPLVLPPVKEGYRLQALVWTAIGDQVLGRSGIAITTWAKGPDIGDLMPFHNMDWWFGELPVEATSRYQAETVEQKQEAFNLLAAMLAFLQQRILIASPHMVERHTRRRLERSGFTHEPLVRVVELRRKQARSEQRGESEPVEWSHQWIVSGHWRQQFYPSLNANQPIWVMPYVKGPEDKPLKPPRAKVFAVVR